MNTQKHVLIVSHDRSYPGGVANFVSVLMDNLPGSNIYEHFRIGPKRQIDSFLLKPLYPFVDNFRLVWKRLHGRIDCVHLNPSLNPKSLLRDGMFMITLHLIGVNKIILFIHGWDLKTEKSILNNKLYKYLFGAIFGDSSRIIVLASQFRNVLVKIGFNPDKIHAMTTMYEGRIFDGLERNNSDSGKTLIFLSRIIKEKGIYELLDAFKGIAMEFPAARLIFVGDGAELDSLKNKINELGLGGGVVLMGYLQGTEKARALLDSDIFVFPTYYGEGCPVSLLEAMAAGLAVITTSVGGIPDIVKDGVNGIILNDVSPSTIASAIRRLFTEEELCRNLRRVNYQIARSEYEASVVAGRFEHLYNSVMSE